MSSESVAGGLSMYREIATEALKTGETLQVICVSPPDTTYQDQVIPFLAHKPDNYRAHIEGAFAGECDDLETRFYLGILDSQVVGNIMTVESKGAGIFGHVFTAPEQRRKNICQCIMQNQMEDFRQRGGQVLLLGTGYQSPAYRIYEANGFRDWKVGSPGTMRYDVGGEEGTEQFYFAPSVSRPMKAQWRHWSLVALLASIPSPAYLRSLTFGLRGVSLLEGPYCHFFHVYGTHPNAHAYVLESETGAVTAVATSVPDPRWDGVQLLDVFAHPTVQTDDVVRLLEAMPQMPGKTQCYADPQDTVKIAALEKLGFQREAILSKQCRDKETWHDVWLFGRFES